MEKEDKALTRIRKACDYVDTQRDIALLPIDQDILRALVYFEEQGQHADLRAIRERVGYTYAECTLLERLSGMAAQRVIVQYFDTAPYRTTQYYKLHSRRISLTGLMSVMPADTTHKHGLTAREIAALLTLEWPSTDLISSLMELVHERLLLRWVDARSTVLYCRPEVLH